MKIFSESQVDYFDEIRLRSVLKNCLLDEDEDFIKNFGKTDNYAPIAQSAAKQVFDLSFDLPHPNNAMQLRKEASYSNSSNNVKRTLNPWNYAEPEDKAFTSIWSEHRQSYSSTLSFPKNREEMGPFQQEITHTINRMQKGDENVGERAAPFRLEEPIVPLATAARRGSTFFAPVNVNLKNIEPIGGENGEQRHIRPSSLICPPWTATTTSPNFISRCSSTCSPLSSISAAFTGQSNGSGLSSSYCSGSSSVSAENEAAARLIPATNSGCEIVNQKKFKTKLCRSVTNGCGAPCSYGEKCQYAHSKQELRPNKYPPNYKTVKCRQFHSTDSCVHAGRCTFIHDLDSLELQMIREFNEQRGFQQFLSTL